MNFLNSKAGTSSKSIKDFRGFCLSQIRQYINHKTISPSHVDDYSTLNDKAGRFAQLFLEYDSPFRTDGGELSKELGGVWSKSWDVRKYVLFADKIFLFPDRGLMVTSIS